MKAALFAATIVSCMFLGACASNPEAKPGECIVKSVAMLGERSAIIDNGEAQIIGLFSNRTVASFRPDGTFKYHMPMLENFTNGQFVDGRLVMKGAIVDVKSEPIANGRVDLDYGILTKSFTYSQDCTPREAALGAWAIIQTESENAM